MVTTSSYASEQWSLNPCYDWMLGEEHVSSNDFFQGRSVAAWRGGSGAFG